MMVIMTVLTYQAVHWYKSLSPDFEYVTEAAGFVSVCIGALTGCFGILMHNEAKTDRGTNKASK